VRFDKNNFSDSIEEFILSKNSEENIKDCNKKKEGKVTFY
jgi:hypothetical protein